MFILQSSFTKLITSQIEQKCKKGKKEQRISIQPGMAILKSEIK